ncbi:MAG: Ig-like domain-containing protein [Prevotella sp.]|nr:Ig-like domain-containing protein [Staphylococcus sp.]MCM1349786.1 Ig-like domain-containing protein [Prevotella sp.]
MDDPSPYYSDYSYDEIDVTKESLKVGDKICYFGYVKGYPTYMNLHSGIVEEIQQPVLDNSPSEASKIIVSSKWGKAGLYEHKGDYCPYTGSDYRCTSVRYFRPHRHQFVYESILDDSHFGKCPCGEASLSEEHHFEFNYEIGKWVCAECKKEKNPDGTYALHCRTHPHQLQNGIGHKGKRVYQVNIECKGSYDFTFDSPYSLDMFLHNSDGVILEKGITLHDTGEDYQNYIFTKLDIGTYYIELVHTDKSNLGKIKGVLKPYPITKQENIADKDKIDVMNHLHNNQNIYEFYTKEEGFYRLRLEAAKSGDIAYPKNAIIITDSQGNVVDKYDNFVGEAITKENMNNLMFYARAKETYQVDIRYPQKELNGLELYVEKIDELPVKTMNDEDKYYDFSSIQLGDYAQTFHIDRVGTYRFDINYEGEQQEEMKFIVVEKDNNGNYNLLQTKSLDQMNGVMQFKLDVTEPKDIIICYFDSKGLGKLYIGIEKEIKIEYGFEIVTDISNQDCGSEVRLNNGLLGGTTMTQGYTRYLYLGENAPDKTSRLNYNWYSMDESIAKVSAYGTITAIGVGKVKIQAVYKKDTRRIATLEIEVLPYPEEVEPIYLQYGMDVRIGGTISGTEVTSGKGQAIPVGINPEVTIHRGYTRLICLGEDSPTTSVQDFEWQVIRQLPNDTGMVTVSSFGTITGTQEGFVTIKGTYKYNPNYTIYIRIEVI